MTKVLGTADVARLLGVHRATAHRWLAELERRHGPTVVARAGRKLFTTREALQRVAPFFGETERLPMERLKELEGRQMETIKRLNALGARMRELGAQRAAWDSPEPASDEP
jgi:DNA-binding IclR family transcriptional regulator